MCFLNELIKIWRNLSKDFSNYQNPIRLFINLQYGNINPQEVFKNQTTFISDLAEIKKGNPKSKTGNEINVTQYVQKFF